MATTIYAQHHLKMGGNFRHFKSTQLAFVLVLPHQLAKIVQVDRRLQSAHTALLTHHRAAKNVNQVRIVAINSAEQSKYAAGQAAEIEAKYVDKTLNGRQTVGGGLNSTRPKFHNFIRRLLALFAPVHRVDNA